MELDLHANPTVLGRNCIVLQYTGRECDVSPYTDEYEAIKSVPIVQRATAWTDQESGRTFILILNESLWMADQLENSLVNQNQLRYFGTIVEDNPFADALMCIKSDDSEFSMRLEVDGTNVFADTRTPTPRELEECPRIVLSSPQPWDPHSVRFPQSSRSVEEERCNRLSGVYTVVEDSERGIERDDEDTRVCYDIGSMAKAMISSVKVRMVQTVNGIGSESRTTHTRNDSRGSTPRVGVTDLRSVASEARAGE